MTGKAYYKQEQYIFCHWNRCNVILHKLSVQLTPRPGNETAKKLLDERPQQMVPFNSPPVCVNYGVASFVQTITPAAQAL